MLMHMPPTLRNKLLDVLPGFCLRKDSLDEFDNSIDFSILVSVLGTSVIATRVVFC